MVYSTEISICVVVTHLCGLHLCGCQKDIAIDSKQLRNSHLVTKLFKIMLVSKQQKQRLVGRVNLYNWIIMDDLHLQNKSWLKQNQLLNYRQWCNLESRWPHSLGVQLQFEWLHVSPGWVNCVSTVLCLGKTFNPHSASLSTPVYKWVPANLMLGVTLQWTSIPSKGVMKYS